MGEKEAGDEEEEEEEREISHDLQGKIKGGRCGERGGEW